jgi:hypothetical protein
MITVPKTMPPSTLYKYFPPERIYIISDFHIRFSPPSSFNDVFDSYHSLPSRSGMKASLARNAS